MEKGVRMGRVRVPSEGAETLDTKVPTAIGENVSCSYFYMLDKFHFVFEVEGSRAAFRTALHGFIATPAV